MDTIENINEENTKLYFYSDDNIERMYIKEAVKYPVLTPEEEKKALTIIQKYRHFVKKNNLSYETLSYVLNKIPEFVNENITLDEYNIKYYINLINTKVTSLSETEKNSLITKMRVYRLYQKYFNIMINHNQRLVISFAKYYQQKGNPFLDLVQEGNLGLIRAIEKFDVSMNTRFSTYATHWIKQRIARGKLNYNNQSIKIPVHVDVLLKDYQRTLTTLEMKGIEPTLDNIYHEMVYNHVKRVLTNPTEEEIKKYIKENPKKIAANITKEKIKNVEEALQVKYVCSLDDPIKEGDDTYLGLVVDEKASILEENVLDNVTISELFKNKKIKSRSKMIICLRYGLDVYKYLTKEEIEEVITKNVKMPRKEFEKKYLITENDGFTLENLGHAFGDISKEAIKQIADKTLKLMRNGQIK